MSEERREKNRTNAEVQQKLQEREQRLNDLLANLNVIILEGDPENITYIGGNIEGILGYTKEEWLSDSNKMLDFRLQHIHPDDRDEAVEHCLRATREGRDHVLEYRMISKDGRIVWFHDAISVQIRDSRPAWVRTVMTDITGLKQMEDTIRSQRDLAQRYLDIAGVMLIVINSQQEVESINRKGCEILGYSEKEIVGKNWFDHFLPQKERDEVKKFFNSLIKGKIESVEYNDNRVLCKSGEEKTLVWYNTLLRDENGATIGTLSSGLDVTERRKAEEMTRVQQKQLLQADKMITLGILVSGVAHEINNPNNSITLNAQFLEKSWQSILPILDEYYKKDDFLQIGGIPYERFRENIPFLFSGIIDSSKRIKHIVEELKTFSRKDTENANSPIDLNAVAESAVGFMSNIIKSSTHHFSAAYAKRLPLILGDFRKLEQVIINLLQNACQALTSPAEGIIVSTTYNKKNRQVKLRVEDEGVGIPGEDLKYITEPFFTTRRGAGGTGLGLSVSSRIVNDHGGTLHFISNPGKGITAEIRFPVHECKAGEGKKRDK
jgi:PAS domain S-box-containing protein